MNQATDQLPGGDDQFTQQDVPQTNPFTADLKGEFTSNFGTNTNAVSQIFKEGGFVNDKKRMYLIAAVAFLVVAAGAYFMLGSEDPVMDSGMEQTDGFGMPQEDFAQEEELMADEGLSDPALDEPATSELGDGASGVGEMDAAEPMEMTDSPGAELDAAESAAATAPPVTGSLSVISPTSGQSRSYDEANEAAVFEWSGSADRIVFSRSSSMTPVVRTVNFPNGASSYQFLNPHPGTWYWQIHNAEGASEVQQFTILSPQRLNLVIGQPATGESISGSGGIVSWNAPHSRVAFYRVELSSTNAWGQPDYRFATSGTSVTLQDVSPGAYSMRLGGFSEISGQWEYSAPISITAQ